MRVVIYNKYLYTVNWRFSILIDAASTAFAAIYKVKGQVKACALHLVRLLGQRTDEPHELALIITNDYSNVSLSSFSEISIMMPLCFHLIPRLVDIPRYGDGCTHLLFRCSSPRSPASGKPAAWH